MNEIPTVAALSGPMADRASEIWPVLMDIRAAVARRHAQAPLDPGVGGGLGGAVLLNRYLFAARPDPEFEQDAEQQLDEILGCVNRMPLTQLYRGVVGVGWLLAHLSCMDGDEPDVRDLDDMLGAVLDQRWRGPYDIISGLVGVGFYAVERIPHSDGRRLLARVVERLAEMAEHGSDGSVSWFTPPALIPPTQIESCPDGYYNLGFAHGVPGCLRLLVEAIRNDVKVATARRLVNGIVPWILSKLVQIEGRWHLPSFYVTSELNADHRPRTRLAWCYNELGALTAVVAAAQVCGRDDWMEHALTALWSTFGSRPEECGCRDACLCHGTAGVAHIYQRLGNDLDDRRFLDESVRWFESTLRMYHPGTGCGGYAYYNAVPTLHDPEWSPRPGLLEGSTGIALALLSSTLPVGSGWDRLLGLS